MDLQSMQNFLSTTVTELAIKIAAALAFWIIGCWLIGRVIALIQAGMNRNHVDPTLTKYLGSIDNVALNIALVLGILGYFGIQATSFAAMLAGAGVAIGAAWSGLERPGVACWATLRPAPSCWCCGHSRLAISSASEASLERYMSWGCSAPPSSRPTTS
jgi:hypothetical protein